ncbi:Adenosine 3'-phospho 5'-phosphosulfate transporter 2 [Tritrichomonas foetus]|uniref:Adenosine 3'-phospho 5'-phosphosulfate transporter 2 n=1 Tax=Tritrichomonas foetus TaxID=1144522 RepID=A0A1J4JJP0_9EUKA|nr:Adenosine 3'-phospho 5'-phosphosulfate transporter 2 [Tritrichomonas foetus]|eukprot:OHS97739.1 Adenosine 3'-phospho 5'-phosphosulfate transporter 2 [Tritrichomonas foetus]
MASTKEDLRLFGLNISSLPKPVILIIGVVGIFVSFLLQGTAQETLAVKFHFNEIIFLTLVQFVSYFLFSSMFIFRVIAKKAKFHAPFYVYLFSGIPLCISMFSANISCNHLSYPTQVLFKSSKMVPLMIVGYVFMNKRYSLFEVCSVLLVTSGLIGISLSDIKAKNTFDSIGLITIFISLICDAISSNAQDKLFSTYKCEQSETIAMTYGIGSLLLLVASIVSGQLNNGITACIQNRELSLQVFYFAFLGAAGVQFVFLLIKSFGSLNAVMVTSLRKAFSICLSFLMFDNKKFTAFHAASIAAIFIGVGLNTLKGKLQKKKEVKSVSEMEKKMK